MKELLEVIARNLVDNPDAVTVKEVQGERSLVLGKVIGKQGRIAKAIRTVVKAAAVHEDKHIVVEIVQ